LMPSRWFRTGASPWMPRIVSPTPTSSSSSSHRSATLGD
jgi:hypothetical protein